MARLTAVLSWPLRHANERGQTMAETALILMGVSIVAAAGAALLGPAVDGWWHRAIDAWP